MLYCGKHFRIRNENLWYEAKKSNRAHVQVALPQRFKKICQKVSSGGRYITEAGFSQS
jgi:hypothetical protein